MEETLKISLSLLAILCALSSAGVSSSREAAALVFDDLLALDITGRTVSYLPEAVYQGQGIEAWHETVVSLFSGYLVLVDDMALANWEHPCRWVFVAFDGTTSIVEMHTPPLWLERMEVYRTSLPAVSSIDNRQALLDWFVPNPQTPENDPEHTYAWIISGGANQGSNHIRYYGDVQFLYLTLTQDYGYTNDHIVICFADGTNPAVDNSSGGNSNPDLDGDGTVDFDFDASYDGIWNGYNQILSLVGSDDHLFIFTTDHGGSGKGLTNLPPEAYLNLWNSQQWNDDAYDTWIDAFNTISSTSRWSSATQAGSWRRPCRPQAASTGPSPLPRTAPSRPGQARPCPIMTSGPIGGSARCMVGCRRAVPTREGRCPVIPTSTTTGS